MNTRTYLAGIVLPLALYALPVLSSEPRVDLTVCADSAMDSFRVVEVAYTSNEPVPCTTYLSSEKRSVGDSSKVSEQVAWARTTPGLCERSARKLRRTLERRGYLCLTHKADVKALPERPTIPAAPPVEINLVGRQLVEKIPVPSVFVEAENAESKMESRPSGSTPLFVPVTDRETLGSDALLNASSGSIFTQQ